MDRGWCKRAFVDIGDCFSGLSTDNDDTVGGRGGGGDQVAEKWAMAPRDAGYGVCGGGGVEEVHGVEGIDI